MIATGPAESATALAIRERVLAARAAGAAMRITGTGEWVHASRPVHATEELSLRPHAGVIEYVPGDLTITVAAGTTLGAIADVTRASRQWLTLDPFGSDNGTIGATVATASAGPLAHQFGTPRDVVLGVEFVTGSGAVVRGGGRVVKNVAGFDLCRLITGSWGTLGAITEVTLRLRALPEVDRTLVLHVVDSPQAIADLRRWIASLPFVPMAAELVDAPTAAALRLDGRGPVLLMRLGGPEAAVRAQEHELDRVTRGEPLDSGVWRTLRALEPAGAAVVRLSDAPSRLAGTWTAAKRIADRWPGTLRHATLGRGVVRCILPRGGGDYGVLRDALASASSVSRVFEQLPARLWTELAAPAAMDRLSRGLRSAFDPDHILNRGILGGTE